MHSPEHWPLAEPPRERGLAVAGTGLADQLVAAGDLHDRQWWEAVASTPRHVLVPRYHEQEPAGTWRWLDAANPGYWDAVYSDRTLLVALAEVSTAVGVQQVQVSSSTEPGLVVSMLEALEVDSGCRVLEIGTGSGYNAALLCHRLGDRNVFSVDLRPDLVEVARERLAACGYRPLVAARDGVLGVAEHGPFDRVIATCAVPAVPVAWLEQTRPGGLILVDIQGSMYAGNVARLRRSGDGAQGRFYAVSTSFMPMRHSLELSPMRSPRLASDDVTERLTMLDPAVLDRPVNAFVAQLQLPPGTSRRTTVVGDTVMATKLIVPDGSWCEASHAADARCRHRVLEAGPTKVWSLVEDGHDRWLRSGSPGWTRFGVTVAPDRQHVWLDDPAGESWPLPTGDGDPGRQDAE